MTSRLTRLLCHSCILSLGLALFATADAASAASGLKCRPAHGTIERLICTSPEYLAIDHEIAALLDLGAVRFAMAPEDRRRLFESQTAYLRRRAGCDWASHNSAHPGAAIDECVRASMEARVHTLREAVDPGSSAAR